MDGRQHRFITLDAMRGVAALVVLAWHVGGPPAHVLCGSYLAVDFFFCLSGFVLAHAYLEAPLATVRFMQLRAIRLYPLYLAGLVLGAITIATVSTPARIGASSLGLVFLPSPFRVNTDQISLYPLDPPAWSLLFEVLANAIWFPFRRQLTGIPGYITLSAIGASLAITVGTVGSLAGGIQFANFAAGLPRVAYPFLAGVLMYRIWRASSRPPRLPWWLPMLALLTIFVIPGPRALVDGVAMLILVPLAVYLGACAAPRARISVALQRKLGDASYAIYVLHWPIIAGVHRLLIDQGFLGHIAPPFVTAHPSLVTTPLTFALVIGLALALDRFYDGPARSWLRRALSEAHKMSARTP